MINCSVARLAARIAPLTLALGLVGCGMKGPLVPATPPPPVNPVLTQPPAISPAAQTPKTTPLPSSRP
jgi:predicted small lipoprotein YifL